MARGKRFTKDPNSVEWYYVVWCDEDGTNSGAAADAGDLQGATISTSNWTVPTGITNDSTSVAAVTYHGVTYGINTVAAIKLSGGTAATSYEILNRITTSDGRTLDHTFVIEVVNQ